MSSVLPPPQGVIRQKKVQKKKVQFVAGDTAGPSGSQTTTEAAAAAAAGGAEAGAAATAGAGEGSDCEMQETFSDIDDDEIDNYLHTGEEAKLKEVIWTAMNREYLDTQVRCPLPLARRFPRFRHELVGASGKRERVLCGSRASERRVCLCGARGVGLGSQGADGGGGGGGGASGGA